MTARDCPACHHPLAWHVPRSSDGPRCFADVGDEMPTACGCVGVAREAAEPGVALLAEALAAVIDTRGQSRDVARKMLAASPALRARLDGSCRHGSVPELAAQVVVARARVAALTEALRNILHLNDGLDLHGAEDARALLAGQPVSAEGTPDPGPVCTDDDATCMRHFSHGRFRPVPDPGADDLSATLADLAVDARTFMAEQDRRAALAFLDDPGPCATCGAPMVVLLMHHGQSGVTDHPARATGTDRPSDEAAPEVTGP